MIIPGWQLKIKPAIRELRLWPLNNCDAKLVKTSVTTACKMTLNVWNPVGERPCIKLLILKLSTVKGRYEPWVFVDFKGVPQKSLANRLNHEVDGCRSWFVLIARLWREAEILGYIILCNFAVMAARYMPANIDYIYKTRLKRLRQ